MRISTPTPYRNRERGSTLLLSLVVLAGLVAILASLAANQHAMVKAQINREERARAKMAADSGIQLAMATLAQITVPGQAATTPTATPASSVNTTGATLLSDDWATLGQNGDEHFLVGPISFRLQIVDGCSLLNINNATTAMLNLLPFQQDEIAAITDFRSGGNTPSALGAKDEYYNNLQQPYNTKEAPFETFDELLQVRGLTPKLLYEPRTDVQSSNPTPTDINGNQMALSQLFTTISNSPQLRPNGQPKINANTASQAQLRQLGLSAGVVNTIAPTNGRRPTYATMGQLMNLPGETQNDRSLVLTNLSADGATTKSGRININTASQAVLQSLPGVSTSAAAAIVQQQSSGFTTLGQIATTAGVNAGTLAQIADLITASSSTFIIRVIGTAGSTSIPIEAIVNMQNGTPHIVLEQEQPFPVNQMITRWTWNTDTNTDTVLKDNS